MSEVTHALSTQIHLPLFWHVRCNDIQPDIVKGNHRVALMLVALHCTWRVISAVQEREKPIAWRIEVFILFTGFFPVKRVDVGFWDVMQIWLSHHPKAAVDRKKTIIHCKPWWFKASSEDDMETRTADSQPSSMFQPYRYPFCNTVAPKWATCRDQVLERVLLSTSTCCRTLRNPIAQCLGQYLESVEGKSATWIHMVVPKSHQNRAYFGSGCRINIKLALEDIWSLHKPS